MKQASSKNNQKPKKKPVIKKLVKPSGKPSEKPKKNNSSYLEPAPNFSAENQPPAKNKSKGKQEHFNIKKARETFFNHLLDLNIEDENGNKIKGDTLQETAKLLQKYVFKNKKNPTGSRLELMLKFIDKFTPNYENDLNLNVEERITSLVFKEDKNAKRNKDN